MPHIGPHCYYHVGRAAIFQISLDGGGKAPVCASCHAKIKGEKEDKE